MAAAAFRGVQVFRPVWLVEPVQHCLLKDKAVFSLSLRYRHQPLGIRGMATLKECKLMTTA